MRFFTGAVALMAALLLAPGAFAATMVAKISGYVIYGEDQAGFFGTPGNIFEGQRYVATFVFDPDRARRITTGTFDAADGGTIGSFVAHPYIPVLSATLEIDGTAKSFGPMGYASVRADISSGFNAYIVSDVVVGDLTASSYFISLAPFAAVADLTSPQRVDDLPMYPTSSFVRWQRVVGD